MAVMFAICIIVFYESICAIDRACNLAVQALDEGFKSLQGAVTAFYDETDMGDAIAPLAGSMDKCAGFNGTADIEPRLWREDWKYGLCSAVI